MKLCTKCGEDKPLTGFYRGQSKKVYAWCRSCRITYSREYYHAHRDNDARRERWQQNKDFNNKRQKATRYGITVKQLDEMLEAQDFSCAICGTPEALLDKSLGVDHCHSTGAVRGLLCDACNGALGLFRDQEKLLRAAAEYLSRARALD